MKITRSSAGDRRPKRPVVRKSTGGVTSSDDDAFSHHLRRSSNTIFRPRRQSQQPTQRTSKSSSQQNFFHFEQTGLALDMDVSGITSESNDERPTVVPKQSSNAKLPTKSQAKSLTPPKNRTPPISTWVRTLVALRKVFNVDKSLALAKASEKQWLREQLIALDENTIPVTLKCILAASGISKRFSDCRDTFLRPEYRARYWDWSRKYIALLDYFVLNGNSDVHPRSTKYANIVQFITTCRSQRDSGSLPPQRVELLSALKLKWQEKQKDIDSDLEDESEQEEDSKTDETWSLTNEKRSVPLRRRKSLRTSLRKRKRSQKSSYVELDDDSIDEEDSDSGKFKPLLKPIPRDPKAVRLWAKRFIQLRRFFKSGDKYEIPDDRPELTIWMNTELAKRSMGTLTPVCGGILNVARLGERSDMMEIEPKCQVWCTGYIEYIDFSYRHRRTGISYNEAPERLTDFLFDCWRSYNDFTMTEELQALLKAVDMNWLDSSLMKISKFRNKPRRPRMKKKKKGHHAYIDEVVIDSGTVHDLDDSDVEPPIAPAEYKTNRNKRASQMCDQMVSSMIKGIVAENIVGREKTEAERFAEEWVSNAGPQALNQYARNWFRTATHDSH